MPSSCFWCHIKKLEDYILITKFLQIKCKHLDDKVHLDYYFSPKNIIIQFIYFIPIVTLGIESAKQLINNPDMDASNYWFEIGCTALPVFILTICSLELISNKNRFGLYYVVTDLLTFAKQAKMELLTESNLKMLYNYIKYMKITLIINPIYISSLYLICFQSDNILAELNVIFATYTINCNAFVAIIISFYCNAIFNNIKNEAKKLFLIRKQGCHHYEDFNVNLRIIQMMLSKIVHVTKLSELSVGSILTASVILFPIALEIILINIQLKFFTNNVQESHNYLREINWITCGLIGGFLFGIFLIQIKLLQETVSAILVLSE